MEEFISYYNVSKNQILGYTNGEEYGKHCGFSISIHLPSSCTFPRTSRVPSSVLLVRMYYRPEMSMSSRNSLFPFELSLIGTLLCTLVYSSFSLSQFCLFLILYAVEVNFTLHTDLLLKFACFHCILHFQVLLVLINEEVSMF